MRNKDKEKEKLQEVNSQFVKLDDSLTENKESKIFETDKKLDFKIKLQKDDDDIIIEDNNDNYDKKVNIEKKSNKIQIENKFEKKKMNDPKTVSQPSYINFGENSNKNYSSNEEINSNQNNKKKYDVSIDNLFYDTLDEPVSYTLKRELLRILYKLECVLLPRLKAEKYKQIYKWDLWGPLLFCLMLCMTITLASDNTRTGTVFVSIFCIIWIGGFIITLNTKFLGAKISIFQTLCLLGYCIFPINISALIVRLTSSEAFIKVIVVAFAYVWSCFSSVGFMSGLIIDEKKMIAVYPIFLFYLFISWFVLTL